GDPLATNFDEVLIAASICYSSIPRASTDPVAGFDNGHGFAGLFQCVGGHHSGWSCTDDDDVAFDDGAVLLDFERSRHRYLPILNVIHLVVWYTLFAGMYRGLARIEMRWAL